MRGALGMVLRGVLWLVYWAVFWFARLTGIPGLRGAQYRATVPLASWTYRVCYGGKPEAFVRY